MRRAIVALSTCAIGAALIVEPAWAQAPIVTDGTMGARAELNGPAMQIPHTLGTQAGPNLFHSFQRFNIPTQNSATFTGPGGIDNVISRVTGGEASTIDGAFRSTIPGANVWFTNPAGVTFGPNASLDVPASFHASTANEIRFPDGGRFSADLGATSTLSVAPPEAFGFLSSNPAPLKVERSQLSVGTDATLSLAAGEIDIQGNAPTPDFNRPELVDINGGTLRAPSGTINLASVSGPAEVKTDGTVSGNHHGAIRLNDGALVNASGDGAGMVRIRGGEVTSTGSYVLTSNTGSVAGTGGIDISADRISLQDDPRSPSLVTTNAQSAGNAVPINVRAQDVTMRNSDIRSIAYAAGKAGNIQIDAPNQMTLDNLAGVFASSLSLDPAGAGGDITVNAGNLVIKGLSQISSITRGPAPAGNITVLAGTLLADGPPTEQRLTGIATPAVSELNGQTTTPGKAGNITVSAHEIRLTNGAQITSYTQGPHDAGNIHLIVDSGTLTIENGSSISSNTYAAGKAGNIQIDAPNQMTLDNLAGVFASSLSLDPAGAGGDITVNAGNLVIKGLSQISSITRGPAPAGNITVLAGTLLADGPPTEQRLTGIATPAVSELNGQTTTPGKAGNITVSAHEIRLTNGAQITSYTQGPHDAGNIHLIVDSGTLTIENGSSISSNTYAAGKAGNIQIDAPNQMTLDNLAGVFASSLSLDPAGAGGDITVNAGNLVIKGLSQISSITRGPAPAGNITVLAGTLLADGPSTEQRLTGIATPAVSELNGQTTTPGKAGNITVSAHEIRLTNGAQITSYTQGPHDAGNIHLIVDSGTLTIENGSQINNTTYEQGNAGTMRIDANNLTLNNGDIRSTAEALSELNGQTTTPGKAGNITVSAHEIRLTNGAQITNFNQGPHDAGNIHLIVDSGTLTIENGSSISSNTYAAGKAGNIQIDAPNQMTLDNLAGVFASSLSLDPAGAGGDITVNAGNLVIKGLSQISSITRGPAPAGNITVLAGTLLADGPSTEQQLTGIATPAVSELNGQTTTPGKAGNITVSAHEIRLTNGAQITSYTQGPHDAGNIHLIVDSGTLTIENGSSISSNTYAAGKAGNIQIDAPNQMTLDNLAGVFASSLSLDPAGAGGDITVNAGNLVIKGLSQISSITRGPAPAGNITVLAGTLLADGPSTEQRLTGIATPAVSELNGQTTTPGKAGNITVSAHEIRLTNGAQITSYTQGPHDAGNIHLIVDSGTLTIENGSQINNTTYEQGDAGTMRIDANNLTLTNATISSGSFGSGKAGEIILTGASKLFMSDAASITTQSGSAGGGDIEIRDAGIIVLRDGSRINVDTEAGAQAGDITIDSRFLVLDRSFISANAAARSGGNIRITPSTRRFLSPDSEITARGGPAGVAGTVLMNPETDVTVDVAQLPGAVMNTADQMQERCAVRGLVEGSSFTIAGPEALSPTLEGYLPGTYARVADEDTAVTDGSLMVASGGGLAFPVWTVACGDAR